MDLEEPLVEMASPDLEWADFFATQLAHMLIEYRQRFSPELNDAMRASFQRKVQTFRKNVLPLS